MNAPELALLLVVPSNPPSSRAPSKAFRLGAICLVLAVVGAYLPAINAGFIWDDDLLLTGNRQMSSSQGLVDIWLGKNTCDYTPLTLTTFWLEKRLWQDAPTGYHVTNILLHAAAALLLWQILARLKIPGGWLAALLFAIHPVNVASVAWIAERKNTLSAVFFFAAILFFILANERGRRSDYLGSIVMFLLACLSKGAVVSLPLVLGGCLFWVNGRIRTRDVLRIAPFAAIAFIATLLTIKYQAAGVDYGLPEASLTNRIARVGSLPWLYLRQLFLPLGLSPFAAMWQPNLSSPLTYLPGFLLAGVLALFLWKRATWGTPLLFASGYYLWLLLPVLGLVWMTFGQVTPSADWWQYLAAPGVFALIAAGFVLLLRRANQHRGWIYGSLGLVMILLLVQTWRRCAIYQSMESYCRAVVAENPHAWTLQNNLGAVLRERGDLDHAVSCYRQALADNPRYMQAHNNLANVFQTEGDLAGAEAEFSEALCLIPKNAEVLANLSQNYFLQGRLKEALAANAETIRLDPANPTYQADFGAKLGASGQLEKAVICFRNALLLDPGNRRFEISLIDTLMTAGRADEAALVCEKALQSARKSGNEEAFRAFAIRRDRCRSLVQR